MATQNPNLDVTRDLVASDNVIGTNVYDANGDSVGEVKSWFSVKQAAVSPTPF